MKLLLIGSDMSLRRMLGSGAIAADYKSTAVECSRDLKGFIDLQDYEVGLIDWDMKGESPATFLEALRVTAPDLPVIAFVSSNVAQAEAERAGADEVLTKPVNVQDLRQRVQRVKGHSVERAPLQRDEIEFATQSATMEQMLSVAWRVAPTPASVLILGENGTGKTRLARAMHARSARARMPFVSVNCPCLQPQLLESELFGHVRGSFTGAVSDTVGKVAAAEGGTLFLDEVGELPLEVQSKLLRLLQERCYERLGEARTHTADIRVLAATNRDLRQQVLSGWFREDLYYRLNVITIEMPPLRSRPEDIIPSAEYFLSDMSRSTGGSPCTLNPAAREVLLAHSWPGNLRELRNVIERAAVLSDRPILDVADFPELVGRTDSVNPQVGEFVTLDSVIKAHIRRVTARAESYEQAARILGIDKSTLYRRRRRLEQDELVEAGSASS